MRIDGDARGSGTGKVSTLLADAEALFGDVFGRAGLMAWIADAELTHIIWLSESFESICGLPREALYADPSAWLDIVHPDDRARVDAARDDLLNRRSTDRAIRIIRPDGAVRSMRVRADVTDAAHVAGIVQDVTEQKLAEARLTVQHAVSRLLATAEGFDGAAPRILEAIGEPLRWAWVALWMVDGDGAQLRLSASWCRPELAGSSFARASRELLLARGDGLPAAAWEGRQPLWIDHVGDDPRARRAAPAKAAGLATGAFIPVEHGGEVIAVFELLALASMPPDPDTRGVLDGLAHQMGLYLARVRGAEELQRKTRQLELLNSSLSVYAATNDARLAAHELVRGAVARTGSRTGMLAVVVKGSALRTIASHDIDGAVLPMPDATRLPETDLLWAAIHGRRTVASSAFLAVPVVREDTVVGTIAVAKRAGGYPRSVQADLEMLAGVAGALCHAYLENEQSASLQEQLRQSQKMEAIGRLAGGVAHDFNNLLQIINGYADIVLEDVPKDAPERDALERVRRAGGRAAGLTRQLLAFSRKQALELRSLDIGKVTAEAHKMFLRLIGEDIAVHVVVEPDLRPVRADAGQIEQVLLNLLVNARDAMPQGGRVIVECANATFTDPLPPGAESSAPSAPLPPGRYVRLSVTDTGTGIAREVLPHIFEPFFTTKSQERGTGLGLSTVHGIVHQSGGHVRVYSEIGKGTSFHVYLPAADAAEAPAASAPAAPARGHETILVVDDEPDLCGVCAQMLRGAGFTVLQASDPDSALAVSRAHTGRIDLLLTDVVMPGSSGPALAENLRRLRPDVDVLFMSGYTEHASLAGGFTGSADRLLHKPFDRRTLLAKVRAVLDARASRTDAAVAAAPPRALVVDDTSMNSELVARLLEKHGWVTDTAPGGQEALDRLREQRYDAVLMDALMPGVDGFEATRRLRGTSMSSGWATPPSVPVIGVTAVKHADGLARGRAAGMDDVLFKPIGAADLMRALGRLCPASARPQPPPPPAVASSAVTRLDQLRDELGDRASLRLLHLFLNDLEDKLAVIRDAARAHDAVALKTAAHALRGSAVNLGATVLVGLCDELELAAAGSMTGDLAPLVARLTREADRLGEELAAPRA